MLILSGAIPAGIIEYIAFSAPGGVRAVVMVVAAMLCTSVSIAAVVWFDNRQAARQRVEAERRTMQMIGNYERLTAYSRDARMDQLTHRIFDMEMKEIRRKHWPRS